MGKFTFHETKIKGVFVVDTRTFDDRRGYFTEVYNQSDFKAAGLDYTFVQDNRSLSRKGVLRGLHFQRNHPQAKLLQVLKGEIFDVAVDLRRGSETYGQWTGEFLSEENRRQIVIPRGFAHGFLVVSDYAELFYKCDDLYHPEDEGGICWNDADLGIEWPDVGEMLLSDKDKNLPSLKDHKVEFDL